MPSKSDADRSYTRQADAEVRDLLALLLTTPGDVESYRRAMGRLGQRLGEWVAATAPSTGQICVVSAVEDADFLLRGFLDGARDRWDPSRVHVVVYWNQRGRELRD